MGYFVIASYKPKAGKDQELQSLIKNHLPVLRAENLATQRAQYVMKAQDGTYVEIFEWASKEAVEKAHSSKAVQEMWEKFGKVCDFQSLSNLKESKELFAHFEPIDF